MEIAPGLHRLPGVVGVNVYAWLPTPTQRGPGEPCLFDCGFPWSGRAMVDGLAELGCRPADIRTIAITHDDFDHVGRTAALQAVSGAQVAAHRLEAERLTRETWREPPAQLRMPRPLQALSGLVYGRRGRHPVQVDRQLEDGDGLPGGWIAIHTPGHTPGHTSYFHPVLRALIAGDALGSTRYGRIRAPQPIFTEDQAEAARSIRKLAALEPEIICFGHGPELLSAAEPLRGLAESLVVQVVQG